MCCSHLPILRCASIGARSERCYLHTETESASLRTRELHSISVPVRSFALSLARARPRYQFRGYRPLETASPIAHSPATSPCNAANDPHNDDDDDDGAAYIQAFILHRTPLDSIAHVQGPPHTRPNDPPTDLNGGSKIHRSYRNEEANWCDCERKDDANEANRKPALLQNPGRQGTHSRARRPKNRTQLREDDAL